MATGRVQRGAVLAAVGGVVLTLSLFLPWYGVDAPGVSGSADAWETLELIDLVLLAVALAAVGWAAALATGAVRPTSTVAAPVAVAGLLAVALVVFRIVDLPTPAVPARFAGVLDYGLRAGPFVALAASVCVAAGALMALRPPSTSSNQ